MEAFTDGFLNSYSTYSVKVDTWDVVADSYTYIPSNQAVTGWIMDLSTSAWVVKPTTWSILEYTKIIVEQSRRKTLNDILDGDVEQFMVWPDTTSCPADWRGWMASYVNGKIVPVPCK